MSDKPITFKVGRVRAAVWANESEKGPWYSVSATRSYRRGEEWKQSDRFGQDDLLVLAKLLGMAYSWIWTQQQQARQQAA